MPRLTLTLLLVLACLPLTGCITPHGVEMLNKTGRTLDVEYLHVRKDGTLVPYSTAILSADGTLKHHPPIGDGFVGERVRITIAGAPADPGSSILLHIPDNRTRDYDIEYVAGRLVAREYKKGRDWAAKSEPGWTD